MNKADLYLTNRFHVAVRLFSNRSQMTSKCGKNKKVAHEAQPSVSLMFLPHFDVLCDLLLNRRTATWNLFVLYNKKIRWPKRVNHKSVSQNTKQFPKTQNNFPKHKLVSQNTNRFLNTQINFSKHEPVC